MIMLLDMPNKGESITIKITGRVDVKIRNDKKSFICPCRIWCDPRDHPEKHGNKFDLKLNELWVYMLEVYKALEELAGDEYKVDRQLIRIIGDIFTIKCIEELKNDVTGNITKSYDVDLREDLKDLDMRGEWEDIIKVKKEIFSNEKDCVDRNMVKVDPEYATNLERAEIARQMRKQRRGTMVLGNIESVVGWK